MAGDASRCSPCGIEPAHRTTIGPKHLRVPIDEQSTLRVEQGRLDLDRDERRGYDIFEGSATEFVRTFTMRCSGSVVEG